MSWQLTWVDKVLKDAPESKRGWSAHWLDIIKQEDEKGVHPDVPEFGFGDPSSTKLISDVVNTTQMCGAVRHGACHMSPARALCLAWPSLSVLES